MSQYDLSALVTSVSSTYATPGGWIVGHTLQMVAMVYLACMFLWPFGALCSYALLRWAVAKANACTYDTPQEEGWIYIWTGIVSVISTIAFAAGTVYLIVKSGAIIAAASSPEAALTVHALGWF